MNQREKKKIVEMLAQIESLIKLQLSHQNAFVILKTQNKTTQSHCLKEFNFQENIPICFSDPSSNGASDAALWYHQVG